ncbi:MAG: hypothetical protein R6V55_11875 [Desulfovermiculus sp.]
MTSNKKHQISIRVPHDLYERVKFDADNKDQTLTDVILDNITQNYTHRDIFDFIHATHEKQSKCLHDILQLLHNLSQEQKNTSQEIEKLKPQVSKLTMSVTQLANQAEPGQSKEDFMTKFKKKLS